MSSLTFSEKKKKNRMFPAAVVLSALMLSTLGKLFSRQHSDIFFLFFEQETGSEFHANCLHWKQLA